MHLGRCLCHAEKGIIYLWSHKSGGLHAYRVGSVLWKICTWHIVGKQQPCSSRCSGVVPVAFLLRLLEGQLQNGRHVFIILCIPEPSTKRAWWLRALAKEVGCLSSLPHLILCYFLSLCFWVKDLRADSFLVDNPRKHGELAGNRGNPTIWPLVATGASFHQGLSEGLWRIKFRIVSLRNKSWGI